MLSVSGNIGRIPLPLDEDETVAPPPLALLLDEEDPEAVIGTESRPNGEEEGPNALRTRGAGSGEVWEAVDVSVLSSFVLSSVEQQQEQQLEATERSAVSRVFKIIAGINKAVPTAPATLTPTKRKKRLINSTTFLQARRAQLGASLLRSLGYLRLARGPRAVDQNR